MAEEKQNENLESQTQEEQTQTEGPVRQSYSQTGFMVPISVPPASQPRIFRFRKYIKFGKTIEFQSSPLILIVKGSMAVMGIVGMIIAIFLLNKMGNLKYLAIPLLIIFITAMIQLWNSTKLLGVKSETDIARRAQHMIDKTSEAKRKLAKTGEKTNLFDQKVSFYYNLAEDGSGLIELFDGRYAKMVEVNGVLSKTTLIDTLETVARNRRSGYVSRDQSIEYILLTSSGVIDPHEKEVAFRKSLSHDLQKNNASKINVEFTKRYLMVQNEIQKRSSTSTIKQYLLITSKEMHLIDDELTRAKNTFELGNIKLIRDTNKIHEVFRETFFPKITNDKEK